MPARFLRKPAERPGSSFFAVFMAANGLICGIGHTEEAAWAIAEALEEPDEMGVYYDVKPCSPGLLREVMANGGDVAYDDRHGTLVTEQEARRLTAALKAVR